MQKCQISISLKIVGPAPEHFTLLDAGEAIEIPDPRAAQNLYGILDQILRDTGKKLGAERRERARS